MMFFELITSQKQGAFGGDLHACSANPGDICIYIYLFPSPPRRRGDSEGREICQRQRWIAPQCFVAPALRILKSVRLMARAEENKRDQRPPKKLSHNTFFPYIHI